MTGKNADATFLSSFGQCTVDPAKALHIIGVNANAHSHARFTHPNMIGVQIALEGKILEDGVIRTQQARKAIFP